MTIREVNKLSLTSQDRIMFEGTVVAVSWRYVGV